MSIPAFTDLLREQSLACGISEFVRCIPYSPGCLDSARW
jgi:hypothetical protein